MFVDTSAAVAVIARESDADRYIDVIAQAPRCLTAPHVRLEACMVLVTKLDRSPAEVGEAFDRFLADGGVTVVPITDEIGRLAVEAFGRFGKGRGGRAQLNLGDCFSYAAAKAHGARILFKGNDFAHTDLAPALDA